MRIALGTSDFRELRRDRCDYVDKSLLIRDIIDETSKAVLLPRPRRFGKTLNLSMLRYYFERPPVDSDAEERWALFADLAIAQAGERYRDHFQRYPTIHMTFKDIKDASWERCLATTASTRASSRAGWTRGSAATRRAARSCRRCSASARPSQNDNL